MRSRERNPGIVAHRLFEEDHRIARRTTLLILIPYFRLRSVDRSSIRKDRGTNHSDSRRYQISDGAELFTCCTQQPLKRKIARESHMSNGTQLE
jgi:hypothetical protein